MRLLYVDLITGTAAVCAIAIAAQRPRDAISDAWRRIGWALIAIPLPLVVLLHLVMLDSGDVDQALFIAALGAFAVGAVLVLGRDDEDDGARPDDPEPAWWPDFEQAFRDYSRQRPRVPSS